MPLFRIYTTNFRIAKQCQADAKKIVATILGKPQEKVAHLVVLVGEPQSFQAEYSAVTPYIESLADCGYRVEASIPREGA